MRIRYHQKMRLTKAIFLLAVLSLLQLSLWGPAFIHLLPATATPMTCQGDHARCGCSPSRIAAKTCCCALASIEPCCQKNYLESALEEKAALGTVIASLPCGGSDDPLVTANSEAWLLPALKISDSPLSTTVYPLVAAMSQIEHHISPPVPPPKV